MRQVFDEFKEKLNNYIPEEFLFEEKVENTNNV